MQLQPLRLAAGLIAAVLLLVGAPALAKEESKIRLPLERVAPSAAPSARGFARVTLTPWRTVLHLHVRGLEPSTEYIVTFNGEEFTRFTTWGNGKTNRFFDLTTDGVGGVPMDPRGTLLAVNDGTEDILAGVVSGPMEPRRTRAKEWTELEAQGAPAGRAFARFHRTPNGFMRFAVIVRGGDSQSDYEVFLDGAPLGTISTNSGGWGRLFFRGNPDKANPGGGNRWWQPLTFDPRYGLIEIVQNGTVAFSGPMAAQIAGLNDCDPDQVEVALTGATADGTVRYGVGDDCDDQVAIEAAMLAQGAYDVELNDVVIGTLTVGVDGTGALVFETQPESGELLLDFALQSGDVVEVVDPATATTELSATIP